MMALDMGQDPVNKIDSRFIERGKVMATYEVKEDTLYYKSMRLKSAQLVVEVREAADYSYTDSNGKRIGQAEDAKVTIFHSAAKWDQDKFHIQLKNRTELQEYISMLQEFDKKYGHLLDLVQNDSKAMAKSQEEPHTVYVASKARDDLYEAILQLNTVCSEHMLPLENIGFSGDIGLKAVSGVAIHNTQFDEIGAEE
jgi:uncharacterized protein YajQ (UPF0234 family)